MLVCVDCFLHFCLLHLAGLNMMWILKQLISYTTLGISVISCWQSEQLELCSWTSCSLYLVTLKASWYYSTRLAHWPPFLAALGNKVLASECKVAVPGVQSWVPTFSTPAPFSSHAAPLVVVYIFHVHCGISARDLYPGPMNKVMTEFEENTMETNCLCLLWNPVAGVMMSRGCHGMENKSPKGIDWEMTD